MVVVFIRLTYNENILGNRLKIVYTGITIAGVKE